MEGKTSEEKKDNASESLIKKDREFVIPGDKIVGSMDYIPGRNCYREGDSIYAKRLGVVSASSRVVSVIPLTGAYMPKPGDMVIGEVEEIQSNGWVININGVYLAYLPLSGVREYIDTTKSSLSYFYSIGDVIYAKVSSVNSDSVHITMQDTRARKFKSGRIITISAAKVPRLIGKDGSMIIMIKERTGCRITVGQNGFVWIDGEKEDLAIKAIELVEREAAYEGLTDKVSALLGPVKEVKPVRKAAVKEKAAEPEAAEAIAEQPGIAEPPPEAPKPEDDVIDNKE